MLTLIAVLLLWFGLVEGLTSGPVKARKVLLQTAVGLLLLAIDAVQVLHNPPTTAEATGTLRIFVAILGALFLALALRARASQHPRRRRVGIPVALTGVTLVAALFFWLSAEHKRQIVEHEHQVARDPIEIAIRFMRSGGALPYVDPAASPKDSTLDWRVRTRPLRDSLAGTWVSQGGSNSPARVVVADSVQVRKLTYLGEADLIQHRDSAEVMLPGAYDTYAPYHNPLGAISLIIEVQARLDLVQRSGRWYVRRVRLLLRDAHGSGSWH